MPSMFPVSVSPKHLVAALLAGLALRLFFLLWFPVETPDTKMYEELARNWLDHGVYGLVLDGHLTAVDARVPGYPAFLAAVYALAGRGRLAVMLAQALLDLLTCFLTAALAARLAPEASRQRAAAAALWLAALCPFTANYTAVPLTEVWATFFTAAALLLFVAAEGGAAKNWFLFLFLGGLAAGLGTLVRPETPLLLLAAGLVLAARSKRPADWPKLLRAGLGMALGLLLPLLPWAARNAFSLGRVQFLAPRYTELPGEYVPRGAYAWTKTWLVRYADNEKFLWRLEEEPIRIEDLPASAFDSQEERRRVAALLEKHNQALQVSPELDARFAQLARERAARHPLRAYLWIPLGRAGTLWFTPRLELLPYSHQKREDDPVDFSVTLLFRLLNFVYVGLAAAGAWRSRRQPGLALLLVFLLVRTAFFTQVEAPEPRYVLECFPALLALAALCTCRGTARCALPWEPSC